MDKKGTISKTDCRTKEGIAVGLIDSMISIARVLAPMIKKMGEDELPQPLIEALRDLTQDEDVLSVLLAIPSRNVITEERAVAFDGIISDIKNRKTPINLR